MVVAMIGFSWLDLRAFVCFCVVELNQSASLEVVALIKSALALASLYQQSALGKLSAKAEAEDAEAEGLKAAVLAARKALKDSSSFQFIRVQDLQLSMLMALKNKWN